MPGNTPVSLLGPGKRLDKKFLWTDNGDQSFRRLYYSDPNIDKLHDVLRDIDSFLVERTGLSYVTAQRFSRPIHKAISDWSKHRRMK